MEKLELKHAVPYLIHGANFLREEQDSDTSVTPVIWLGTYHDQKTQLNTLTLKGIEEGRYRNPKLILRPLSDYTDINSDGMNDLNIDVADQIVLCDYANKQISIRSVTVGVYQIMCENHIDFNNLIPRNLAVDAKTIKP